jgi:hypothetical protein
MFGTVNREKTESPSTRNNQATDANADQQKIERCHQMSVRLLLQHHAASVTFLTFSTTFIVVFHPT